MPLVRNGEPCEVIHWLATRREAVKYVPGVYLCWELVVGNSNCRWYWGTKHGTPEPTVPWFGLMWPDATTCLTGRSRGNPPLDDRREPGAVLRRFPGCPPLPSPPRPGWETYGRPPVGGSGVLKLAPGVKKIAGDPAWTDYALEAVVMLQGESGNAGLVFRVNDPGDGHDEMRGYYVGFDTKRLYLGKMEYNWQPLATFDLSMLDCKVTPGVWNQFRVAAERELRRAVGRVSRLATDVSALTFATRYLLLATSRLRIHDSPPTVSATRRHMLKH